MMTPPLMTREYARKLRREGFTWTEIGRVFGVGGVGAWFLFGPLGTRTP